MIRPLPFQWPWALPFWAVLVWAMAPESRVIRRARREQTATDSRSLHAIMLGQGVGSLLAFYLATRPEWRISASHPVMVFVVGVALTIAGSLLRRHCFRMLGESFTGDVRAAADQQVVERGAYRWLRHPSYTAGMLLNLGMAVALGSWLSVAVMLLLSLPAYIYRMNVEEKALLATIGEPYRQFMATRKRLVPFVY